MATLNQIQQLMVRRRNSVRARRTDALNIRAADDQLAQVGRIIEKVKTLQAETASLQSQTRANLQETSEILQSL